VLRFDRLRLRGPEISVDLGGSVRFQTQIPAQTEILTLNVVILDNRSGRMSRAQDLVYVDVYQISAFEVSPYVETITGRLYESEHGYVDIATLVQLSFGTAEQEFPDSGVLQLTGAGGARIRATAVSSERIELALDLDADSAYEIDVILGWEELSGTVGGDLGDTDGDGMHDGWEIAHGFDPASPSDAAQDADSDGASNLMEYGAGTDPIDGASTPPIVGLSIISGSTGNVVVSGSTVLFSLTVSNVSNFAANDVVVTNTIPPGELISANASQGTCSGLQPTVCNLGTISAFGTVTVSVRISAQVPGVHSNTATVTTSSIDSTASDNTTVQAITVGASSGTIQSLIDGATDGDTIPVAPGVYIGMVNFMNKDVTLLGTAGPAETTIHGNGGLAVAIGPGGTIRGFTITGSPALAVRTHGAGSLISGNVFLGNGRAIEGDSASASIDGNRFRANGCNGTDDGLIVYFNLSSPVITNNVFDGNTCFGVHLILPEGQSPQVVNNTFVDNHGAIKVDRRVSATTQVYRNNLLVGNDVGMAVDVLQGTTDAQNPIWENNLLSGNTTDYAGTANQNGLNGNLSAADPLFVDQAGGNYRLQMTSPAIDAGSATGAPATDFTGITARPQGAGVDIGAFEATS